MFGIGGTESEDEGSSGRKPSLVDDAYRILKEGIRENTFSPGYQGSEQEIASHLRMSRTPVHEALIRLQAEGLVRVLPRRGIIVSLVSADDIREIYEVTIALEAMAAELLARGSAPERTSIADTLDGIDIAMQLGLAEDDLPRWAKADETFHQTLIERCGNGRLARMLSTVADQAHRARMLTLRLRPKPVQSAVEHAAIVDAIRSGDAAAASEAARQHRANARDQIVPILSEFGMNRI